MNERILELMDQAVQLVADKHTKGDVSRLNTDSYHVEDLINEKFAELIVKECMDLALREQKRYAEFPHRNLSECAVTVSNFRLLMKDYFGVKE